MAAMAPKTARVAGIATSNSTRTLPRSDARLSGKWFTAIGERRRAARGPPAGMLVGGGLPAAAVGGAAAVVAGAVPGAGTRDRAGRGTCDGERAAVLRIGHDRVAVGTAGQCHAR